MGISWSTEPHPRGTSLIARTYLHIYERVVDSEELFTVENLEEFTKEAERHIATKEDHINNTNIYYYKG